MKYKSTATVQGWVPGNLDLNINQAIAQKVIYSVFEAEDEKSAKEYSRDFFRSLKTKSTYAYYEIKSVETSIVPAESILETCLVSEDIGEKMTHVRFLIVYFDSIKYYFTGGRDLACGLYYLQSLNEDKVSISKYSSPSDGYTIVPLDTIQIVGIRELGNIRASKPEDEKILDQRTEWEIKIKARRNGVTKSEIKNCTITTYAVDSDINDEAAHLANHVGVKGFFNYHDVLEIEPVKVIYEDYKIILNVDGWLMDALDVKVPSRKKVSHIIRASSKKQAEEMAYSFANKNDTKTKYWYSSVRAITVTKIAVKAISSES